MLGQFDFTKLVRNSQSFEAQLLPWLNAQFARLAQSLRGYVQREIGEVTGAKLVSLHVADLTALTLTGDATLTLGVTDVRRGTRAQIEVTQDATGGRTLAFVNALTAPTIASGAGERTLIDATYTGDGWVLAVLASGY